MTVKQLIKKLSACNQDADVSFIGSYQAYERGCFTFSGAGAGGWRTHLVQGEVIFVAKQDRYDLDGKYLGVVFLSDDQSDIRAAGSNIAIDFQ